MKMTHSPEKISNNSNSSHVQNMKNIFDSDCSTRCTSTEQTNNYIPKTIQQPQGDAESENSDVDAVDSDVCSKPEHITKECLSYINHVNECLISLAKFKTELEREFSGDNTQTVTISQIFKDVTTLGGLYVIILETIATIKSGPGTFHLYDILLHPVIASMLTMYKLFLNQYAINAKLIGTLNRENNRFAIACERARKVHGIAETVNVDNCMYTVFNSLFSLELMYDRYRICFEESSPHRKKAHEAKMVISNLLSSVNTSPDQKKFLETQKELNLLSGKSEKKRINTFFIYKGEVTKYARRDDKQLRRQLVLFSDCLFVTFLPGTLSGTSRVRYELSTNSMQLSEIRETNCKDISDMKWGLNITAKEAVQDFCFDSEETMKIWKEKLLSVIKHENGSINLPIRDRTSTINETSTSDLLAGLGIKAPRWQGDSAAGYCNGYNCKLKFNATCRRHHCRSDGLLYCVSCCNQKMKLDFERSESSRVCLLCFNILFTQQNNPVQREEYKRQLRSVFLKIDHTGKKCGWLKVRRFVSSKASLLPEVSYFCVMEPDSAFLGLFEHHEDKIWAEGIIFLAMDIKAGGGKEKSFLTKQLSPKQFTMESKDTHNSDGYLMTASNEEECIKWVECLKGRIVSTINDTTRR